MRLMQSGRPKEDAARRAEVGNTTEVQFEDLLSARRAKQDDVGIGAEFEGVTPMSPGDVVCELEALFNAVNRGVRFAAEVGIPGNVDAERGTARQIGEAEIVAAAGKLETEFIEDRVARNGVVLESSVHIVQPVQANARAGVLPEHLVLRRGLDAGDVRRSDADTQKRIVLGVPNVIEPSGPQAGFF